MALQLLGRLPLQQLQLQLCCETASATALFLYLQLLTTLKMASRTSTSLWAINVSLIILMPLAAVNKGSNQDVHAWKGPKLTRRPFPMQG